MGVLGIRRVRVSTNSFIGRGLSSDSEIWDGSPPFPSTWEEEGRFLSDDDGGCTEEEEASMGIMLATLTVRE